MFMGQRHIEKAIFVFSVLLFSMFFGCGLMASQDYRSEFLEFRGAWGTACFSVRIADTPTKRAQGLMHVRSLPKDQGMLFIYSEPMPVSFWMKNTKISLDMIFLNARGQIEHIYENAKPYDETVIHGGKDIQYVVEINGGLVAKLGISVGSFVHNRSISKERISKCLPRE
jgi:uncharacterized membrane protein (UPF0127 family)